MIFRGDRNYRVLTKAFAMVIAVLSLLLPTALSSAVAAVPKKPSSVPKKALTMAGGSINVDPKKIRGSGMPTLFTKNEDIYDSYAACLAATEGLRRIRDEEIAAEKESRKRNSMAEAKNRITEKYIEAAGSVLKAMGMSVRTFNELGKEVATNGALKEKVLEQAYLYRMAATVNMDKVPLREEEPKSTPPPPPKAAEPAPTSVNKKEAVKEPMVKDKIQDFSSSLHEIEALRTRQLQRLTQALRATGFPGDVRMTDPKLLPFLHPKVRAVVEAFPYQAEEIVKKHGLVPDEFNQLLKESKTNRALRSKVNAHVKSIKGTSSTSSFHYQNQPARGRRTVPIKPEQPTIQVKVSSRARV